MRICLAILCTIVLASCGGTSREGGDSLAVKFSEIEVGTAYVFRNTDSGLQWMDRYEGKENDLFIVRTYFRNGSGAFSRLSGTDYFDAQGRRVRSDSVSFGTSHVYAPFDCMTGSTGTCTHKRAVFDTETGKRKWLFTKHFEISRSGDTVRVVRNAKSNRLRRTHTVNEANILISQRDPKSQFAMNWELIRTIKPGR